METMAQRFSVSNSIGQIPTLAALDFVFVCT